MISTIKIAGVHYEIRLREKLFMQMGALGFCDYNNAVIEIDADLPVDRMEQVMVHEVVHAMLFEAGFDQESDQWEDLVNRLGIVLHGVIVDNFINEEEEEDESDME